MAKTKGEQAGTKKTECPVTKDQFFKEAKPQTARIGDTVFVGMTPKEMSTGSFGFHGGGRVTLEVGGKPVDFQANLILTAIGSKPEAK